MGALNTYLDTGIIMFSYEFYNIKLCGVAMGRRFACHTQNLYHILGEVFCVGYANFLLYSRGEHNGVWVHHISVSIPIYVGEILHTPI